MTALEEIQQGTNPASFQFKAQETGEQMTMSVFSGRVRITVWPPENSNSRKPLLGQAFPQAGFVMLKKLIKAGLVMNPGDRKTLLFNQWDRDAKKNVPVGSFILGMDEKRQYYFEAQFTHNGNNKIIKFNITASGNVQDSASDFGWPERSLAQLEAIDDWLTTDVPIVKYFTSAKFNGNKGGGGGKSGPSDYGGSY